MNSYEFMSQHPESFNAVFEGLYAYLKRVGINVNGKVYVGKFAHNDRLAWLLLNKDDDPMMYTEYNADKNELNCRRINILEIDYKIPEPKSDPVDSFQHVNWSGLFRQMDEIKDKSTDAPNKISEHFRTLHQPKSKPEPTLKSMINSSMDEIMSELASMKQKAQPTMNKMERVYKAMITELSKDD